MALRVLQAVGAVVLLHLASYAAANGDCYCGNRTLNHEHSKIIGGVRVREGEYPWRVALYEKSLKEKKGLRFFCGGTLINNAVILTAAHCVSDEIPSHPGREIYAAIGYTDIGGILNLKRVHRVLRHERYRGTLGVFSSYAHDIALLFLESPVDYSDKVNPACLPFSAGRELTGSVVSASGWGRQAEHDENTDTYMYAVDLHTYTASECRRRFFAVTLFINNNVFCAHDIGKDTCKGDSGGGVDLLANGRMYSVGITSWGWGCARRSAPGVYTKVSDYVDWIVTNSPGIKYCGQPCRP